VPLPLIPALMHRRAFRNLWIGHTISVFGDQVTLLAIPIIAVLVLHAEPEQMGLLTAAGLLPHLLFSLPAGVWLDRVHRRRRLMIWTDILRALIIGSIAVAYALGGLTLIQLFVVTFLVGTCAVLFDIAWNTLFVSVVERDDYVSANSLFNGSRSLSFVAGPSVGGALIQFLTAPIAVVVDALSYLVSALFLGRVEVTEPAVEPTTERMRTQLKTGLSFIFGDGIMRTTLLSAATLNFFNLGFTALFILYVTSPAPGASAGELGLGISPGELGLVLGAGAVGGIIGALTAATVGRRIGIGRAFVVGLIIFPVSMIIVPLLAPGTPVIVVLAGLFVMEFFAGLGVMILDVNAGAIIPARTPDRIRSRVMGAWRFVNMGIRPIGALFGGFLGGVIGVREALFVTTILACSGVLWLIRSPVLGLRGVPDAAEYEALPAPD
jgi:MFS family permease